MPRSEYAANVALSYSTTRPGATWEEPSRSYKRIDRGSRAPGALFLAAVAAVVLFSLL